MQGCKRHLRDFLKVFKEPGEGTTTREGAFSYGATAQKGEPKKEAPHGRKQGGPAEDPPGQSLWVPYFPAPPHLTPGHTAQREKPRGGS